jgi:hypothetical protein
MHYLKLLTLVTILGMIIGCGSEDTNSEPEQETVTIGKITYLVPEGVEKIDAEITGADATMMKSGTNEEVAGFIQRVTSNTVATKLNKQLMRKGVDNVYTQLINDGTTISNISLISSQTFQIPYVFTIAQYNLVTVDPMSPLDLAGKIVNSIAGGSANGFPLANANAPIETQFRLVLLYAEYEGEAFYIAVVVPENSYNEYQTKTSNITNGANVAPTGKTLTNMTQNFTGSSGSGQADFLFVVDDSGSMSDNQNALSQAASDFTSEISNSGLQYRSAIITTSDGADNANSGDAYRILRDVGIIENNDSLLAQSLVAGTWGSGTETGIWNAEQALLSTTLGDSTDGAITLAGMPKDAQTTLSVIILSDESSQYTSRAGYGNDFNVSSSLFIDRNIKVYGVIQTDQNDYSQYDDLATETGGIYADIDNINATTGNLDFSAIMTQIAQDAGGAASSFVLPHAAASIDSVTVNGTAISQDATNGWTYIQSSQSIIFHGTSIPQNGDTIIVNYKYYQ